MSQFNDKTVLITGAGRGIGRTMALEFASAGARVCINYANSADGAKQAVAEIEQKGGTAIVCKADISSARDVEAMIESTIAALGPIDILINNAGLSRDGSFLQMSEQDWDDVYAVNLKGPFLVSQAAARNMMEHDGGVIVNISATTTTFGRPNAANYCASKAGLNMLTKCMALELAPSIRVNGLGLGFVDSPLVNELYSPQQKQQAVEQTPLKRMTSAKETADFVMLLASDSSAFVTGQTIMFDGGRNMR